MAVCLWFLDPLIRHFISFMTEDIAVYRWEGESVTLKCSSEGCPVSVDESIGMYLNRQDWKGVEEVLYYHRRNGKITLQERFNSRIITTGSLMNHTITISNLTMEDAGCYHCVYVNRNAVRFKCNGYTLVVRGEFEHGPVHSNSSFLNDAFISTLMLNIDTYGAYHWGSLYRQMYIFNLDGCTYQFLAG